MKKPKPEILLDDALLKTLDDNAVVHVIDNIWSVTDDLAVAYVNLPAELCSEHRVFPCFHVELIRAERDRLVRDFRLDPTEAIPDSDRLALRAIKMAVFERTAP